MKGAGLAKAAASFLLELELKRSFLSVIHLFRPAKEITKNIFKKITKKNN